MYTYKADFNTLYEAAAGYDNKVREVKARYRRLDNPARPVTTTTTTTIIGNRLVSLGGGTGFFITRRIKTNPFFNPGTRATTPVLRASLAFTSLNNA